MNKSEEICCFCLCVTDDPITDLFTKIGDDLNNFDKISSSLSQLANVLNENTGANYKVCKKCSDIIDTVYHFNRTCLHNVRIYLTQLGCFKNESEQAQVMETSYDQKCSANEKLRIKVECYNTSQENLMKQEFEINLETERKEKKESNLKNKNLITGDKNMEIISCSSSEDDWNFQNFQKIDILNNKKVFSCKRCGKMFDHKGHLNRHLNTCQPVQKNPNGGNEEKVFICEVCGKKFRQKQILNRHLHYIHSDTSRSFVCDICGKSFYQKFILNCHMSTHTGIKPHKCDMCEKAFSSVSNLKQHKLIHSSVKLFSCDQCNQQFRLKDHLNKHSRVHSGEKPYKCLMCGKAFAQRSTLILHNRIHTGERPYPCNFCTKTFITKSHLDRHVRRIHKN